VRLSLHLFAVIALCVFTAFDSRAGNVEKELEGKTGVFWKQPGADHTYIFVDFVNNGDVYGSYYLFLGGNVSGDGNWW
jgi:hypothetical protein